VETTANRFELIIPALVIPAGARLRVRGTRTKLEFHVGDLCAGLGMVDEHVVRHTLNRISPEHLNFVPDGNETRTPGRPSTSDNAYVTEDDAYEIIVTSRAPYSKPLVTFVCREVLPSIRKHGCWPREVAPYLERSSSRQMRQAARPRSGRSSPALVGSG
jgi:prophage antirepressor-like protein